MKINCEIVRDLIPLYIDGIASASSSALVREHLEECGECRKFLNVMKNDEMVGCLQKEKEEVLTDQARFFRRKSALAGGIIAGIFMIPVLVCLIVNLAAGSGLDWFFIVLASLLTASSLTVVPLMTPRGRGFWTLASFTTSLILLLGVCCLYTGGNWFFVASLSVLFGLAVVFLPFAVRSRPLAALLKNSKGLAVITADTALYAAMMFAIERYCGVPDFRQVAVSVSAPFLLLAWAVFLIARYLGNSAWLKAGICTALCGTALFFANALVNIGLGCPFTLPVCRLLQWNDATVDGNVKWLILLGSLTLGAIFTIISIIRRKHAK